MRYTSAVRRRLAIVLVSSFVGAVVLALGVGRADPPEAPARRRYSLRECLALADRSYPGLAAARHKIGASEAQLREAWVAPFANFSSTGFLAISPQARGNPTFSPDAFGQSPFESGYSYAVRLNVDTAIPLSPWTWYRLGRVRDAARQGIRVAEEELTKARLELRTNVRKAYFGVLFARDTQYLLDRGADYTETAARQIFEGLDAGTGVYAEVDVHRLRAFRSELRARRSEARRGERIALAALGALTGLGDRVDVLDEPSCPLVVTLGPVGRYLDAARLHRPEVAMLGAGVEARRAAVTIQRLAYFPDLALGLTAAVASSPAVADQANPFAANNQNYAFWGAGLVLRWQFEPLANHARVWRMAEELAMTLAQQRLALGGIAVEVQEAYERAVDAQEREAAYDDAEQAAFAWFTSMFQQYQAGTGDSGAVIDPLRQYFLMRFSHLQAIFDLNSALAQLALVTGADEVAGSPSPTCAAAPLPPDVDAGGPDEEEIERLLRESLAAPDAGPPLDAVPATDGATLDLRPGPPRRR